MVEDIQLEVRPMDQDACQLQPVAVQKPKHQIVLLTGDNPRRLHRYEAVMTCFLFSCGFDVHQFGGRRYH